jgi:asparagine synthetase B (glutamine-hydrolysing)
MPVPELIARLYLSKGPNFIRFLHGAFSFALWDQRNEQLVLSIDRFGMKKLYWRQEAHRLLFASRISAIRAAQNGRSEIDPTAILQFLLFSAVPAPLTSDKGIHKLQPGTSLTLRAGNAEQMPMFHAGRANSKMLCARQYSGILKGVTRREPVASLAAAPIAAR